MVQTRNPRTAGSRLREGNFHLAQENGLVSSGAQRKTDLLCEPVVFPCRLQRLTLLGPRLLVLKNLSLLNSCFDFFRRLSTPRSPSSEGTAKNAFVSPKNAFASGKNASASLLHTSQKQNSGKVPPSNNMMTFPEKAVSDEKADKIGLRKIQVCCEQAWGIPYLGYRFLRGLLSSWLNGKLKAEPPRLRVV